MTGERHRVAILVLPHVLSLDFGIPMQAFGNWAGGPYSVRVCAAAQGPVPLEGGPALHVDNGLETLETADTIVVPGQGRPLVPEAPVRAALAAAAARGARMVSICAGAFTLAAAGVLDGRRATTHWQLAAELARAYPAVTVDAGVLYVADGPVLTSAGVAAGIDLCLHIIRTDHGSVVANQRARALVAAPHRPGGQSQYIDHPALPGRSGSLAGLRAWALEHLDEPLSVGRLARVASVSRRTLIRRFHAETGLPPMRWLLDARIDRARELLEVSDAPMAAVARRAGLGSTANLRALFKRQVGATPSGYRATFRQ